MRERTGKYIKELSEFFEGSNNISLVCHTNPDGDAIGSLLGLYHYLTKIGKRCNMVSPSTIPEYLLWLDGADKIEIYEEKPGHCSTLLNSSDLLVMLDFNHISRLGMAELVTVAGNQSRILIDHHPGPDIEADIVISDSRFSSTAELVYDLVGHLEGKDFTDKPFMEAIYVGMMTDTGNFSFGTYDGETLRIVSKMLDQGLRKDHITDLVYDNFTTDRMRLKGFALLERMTVLPLYSTGYIYLSRADLRRFNHRVGDTEGFVNMPLSINNIRVAILFIEKKDHIKLSLRSKGRFSVNTLARKYFNGGGHRNAAGGRCDLPLAECIKYFESILPAIENDLSSYEL